MSFNYRVPNTVNIAFWMWIVAILVAVVLMLTFLAKRNEGRYHGFLGGLYNFLNFRSLTISTILRFIYLVLAISFIFGAFSIMFSYGFLGFLGSLLLVAILEVFLRLAFESMMLVVVGVTNIVEINDKLGPTDPQHRIKFVEPEDHLAEKVAHLKERPAPKRPEEKPPVKEHPEPKPPVDEHPDPVPPVEDEVHPE